MAAVAENFSIEDTIRMTIDAGADLLLLPPVKDTNGFRLTETYLDTAAELVGSGVIEETRIDESVLRILTLKEKYGLLNQTDFRATDERVEAAKAGIGSLSHLKTEWIIAEKVLTLVKNENNAFPLSVQQGEKTLILFADSCASRGGAGDLARKLLEERYALPEGAEILVMKNTRENIQECLDAALKADHVILVYRTYSIACLDPATEDGFSSETFETILRALHGEGKTAILIRCQLPYDAARFPDADAILLIYWGSAMRGLPAEDSTWSANLPAGLLACFGLCSTEGSLPVNLPALDENYLPTGEILWERRGTMQ